MPFTLSSTPAYDTRSILLFSVLVVLAIGGCRDDPPSRHQRNDDRPTTAPATARSGAKNGIHPPPGTLPTQPARHVKAAGLAAQEARVLGSLDGKDEWLLKVNDPGERGRLHDGTWGNRTGRLSPSQALIHAGLLPPKRTAFFPGGIFDQWADFWALHRRPHWPEDENWLIFRSRQMNDHDHVWVQSIRRRGSDFTVTVRLARWTGTYPAGRGLYSASPFNSSHYYIYMNIGRLKAANYTARLVVEPFVFERFDSSAAQGPLDPQPDREQQPVQSDIEWTVTAPASVPAPHADEPPLEQLILHLKRVIPEDWQLLAGKHGHVRPMNRKDGTGWPVTIQPPQSPYLKIPPAIHLWIMDTNYRPEPLAVPRHGDSKGPHIPLWQVPPARELGSWHGRAVLLWPAAQWPAWEHDVEWALTRTGAFISKALMPQRANYKRRDPALTPRASRSGR